MSLIRIDVIIDKMAMLVWGLHHVFIHSNQMNFACSFHNVGLLDNEGKRLVSVMWRCKIITPSESRPKF